MPKIPKRGPRAGPSVIVRSRETTGIGSGSGRPFRAAKPVPKKDQVIKAFDKIWAGIFASPVHLDSALSKLPTHLKSVLAQITPAILLRPSSQAENFGIGVNPGEPWKVAGPKLASWRPAHLLAERMYEMMIHGVPDPDPQLEDFPPEMIQALQASWGDQVTSDLVNTLGREAPLGLRANRKVGATGLLDFLKKSAKVPVSSVVSPLSPSGVRLAGYTPVMGSELYLGGGFEIQDEGSQFMAFFTLWPELYGAYLQGKPGRNLATKPVHPLPSAVPAWTVVDACAGAGGKSLAFGDAMQGKGRIFAYDTSAKKLQALGRRATRAGLNNIQTVTLTEGKEREVISKFRKRAHAVLVDAPCSGWGVLRRNPDIKWRQSSETLARMPALQLRILSQSADLVAPGGRLVYGVCTFRKEETREVVEQFLKANSDFKPGPGGYLGPGPCDGFFMQAFTRA